MHNHIRQASFIAIALCAVGAQDAAAQACIGVPIADGSFSIAGNLGFGESAKSYGASVTANLTGPLTLRAGYDLIDFDDVDENANSFNVGAAYEIPNLNFSACPVVGLQYAKWSTEFFGGEVDISSTVVPIGFGIGKTFPVGTSNAGMTLYAVPQFLYIRGKVSADDGNDEVSQTDSDTEFGSELGIRFGTSAVYAGASVSVTSIEDSDPTFGITVGIVVGRRR